jgi:hypothetical protein
MAIYRPLSSVCWQLMAMSDGLELCPVFSLWYINNEYPRHLEQSKALREIWGQPVNLQSGERQPWLTRIAQPEFLGSA